MMTGTNGTEDSAGEDSAIGEPLHDPSLHNTSLPDTPLQTERLALEGGEERLPWLESDDDDQPAGADGGPILGAGILGLAVLAALVGAIWWFSHRAANSDHVADGSIVAAPDTPYKQAPAAPGGKTFQGTGDTSFAVSAGQSRTGRIAEAAASPGAAASGTASATGAAKPAAAKAPAVIIPATPASSGSAASGTGVQVGAFSSAASAEAAWTRMAATHDALSGVRHRVVEGRADIGTVYRLQAVAGDDAAAGTLCAKLRQSGVACQVKH